MWVYLIGFTLSTVLIYMHQKYNLKWALIGGLLIPILIAGLRNESIGTDVSVYSKQLFDVAQNSENFTYFYHSNWFYIWRVKSISEFEFGYLLLVYICGHFFHSFILLLSMTQALIILPIYKSLSMYKKNFPIWFGMILYYLFFFNSTLNLMRQSIAISFILLSWVYFSKEKWKNSLFYFLIAILFHKTAIIGVCIFALYFILSKKKNISVYISNNKIFNVKSIIAFCLIFVAIIITFNFNLRLLFISMLNLNYYATYIKESLHFSIDQFLLKIPFLLFFILNWNYFKYCKNNLFLICMFFFDVILSQLSTGMVYAGRIAMYFQIFNIISFAILTSNDRKKDYFIQRSIILLLCFLIWILQNVVLGYNATIPYEFWNS